MSSYEDHGVCLSPTQTRLPKLFQKMRQLSEQIMSYRGHTLNVTSLDDFTGTLDFSVRYLRL